MLDGYKKAKQRGLSLVVFFDPDGRSLKTNRSIEILCGEAHESNF